MFKLGDLYYTGEIVPQDYTQAMEWFKKAADAGSAAAMKMIGLQYEYGDGVKKNLKTANEWYQKEKQAKKSKE